MATANIALVRVPAGSRPGVSMTPEAVPAAVSNITTSASSQQSAAASFTGAGEYCWVVTASGGDIVLRFGADPDVSSTFDWLVPDGQTRDFAAVSGHKCAVKDKP